MTKDDTLNGEELLKALHTNLSKQVKSGVQSYNIGDRRVEYPTLCDLLKAIEIVEKRLCR